jgi:hypothetical protein
MILGKQLLDSDWSIRMSRSPQLDINSKYEFHSFQLIQQQEMDQSDGENQQSKSHLDNPGIFYGRDLNLSEYASTSSGSADQITIIGKRRSIVNVIEESDEETYGEYNFINVGIFLYTST